MNNLPLKQLELPFDQPKECVNTLRGPISIPSLGKVLIHEHVFCRVRPQQLSDAKVFLKKEMDRLIARGISTIVDLTTYVLPDDFADFLIVHPINVICCAGYYLQAKVPKPYHSLSADELANKLMLKLENGVGRSKFKPGVIKVASSGRTLTSFEKNVIRAGGIAQRQTGLPIITHACRGARRQLEILLEAGANPSQVVISHMEMELKGVKPLSPNALYEDMKWILEQGAYLFWGDFTANDTQYRREVVNLMMQCWAAGYRKQLLISTDSYWSWRRGKIQLRGSNTNSKNPRTYDYVFSVIIPLLKDHGLSDSDVRLLLEQNTHDLFRPLAVS